jgi:hypothetical protein
MIEELRELPALSEPICKKYCQSNQFTKNSPFQKCPKVNGFVEETVGERAAKPPWLEASHPPVWFRSYITNGREL